MTDNLTRIGDAFTVSIGGTPSRKRSEFWDPKKESNNIWLSIRDISLNQEPKIMNSTEYISDEGIKNSNAKMIPADTALMTFKLTIGKTTVSGTNLYTNEAIAAFLPKSGTEADPYYLATVLPTLNYETDQAVKGKTLNKAKIENALIPLPKISRQKRIAEILTSADRSIASTQRSIDETEKLEKSLMKQLFTRGIGHTKFKQTEIGEIPESWKVGTFADLVDSSDRNAIKPGPFGSSLKKQFYVPSGYKIYGQEQVISGNPYYGDYYVDEAKYKELIAFKVQAGDVLISLVGTIGKVLIVPEDFEPGIINPRLLKITPDATKASSKFIAHLLQSELVLNQMGQKSHGGTMNILNKGMLENMSFGIPSLVEQNKMVEILQSIDNQIEINKKLKFKQEQLKQGLMQDLLTGRVAI
jgi:type I restriction enzyme S subunit